MDCFLDFCLACDKQTMDGLYCSQACRLADLEKAGTSAPVSPSAPGSIDQASWRLSQPTPNTMFSLPTGFDFGMSKSASRTNDISVSQITTSETSSTGRERVLSPSSSRSSLASATSNTSTQTSHVSEQAQQELRGYVSSFDSIRELKRRSLSSNTSH